MPIAAEMPPEIDPQTAAQPKRRRCCQPSAETHSGGWRGRGADGETNGWMDGWMVGELSVGGRRRLMDEERN